VKVPTRLGSSLAAMFALVLGAQPAAADAPRVLLVRPAEAEPPVSAALIRVRGELTADGFEVLLVEAKPGTTSAAAMAEAEHDASSATVGLFVSSDGKSAELWVVDRLTGKTVVRRVSTAEEPTDALSQILAVRAVELLRASLLELMVAKREKQSAPRASPETSRRATEWAERPLAPERRWAIEVGPGVVLTHPGKVGVGVVGVARVRAAFTEAVGARVSLGGLGTRPEFVAPEGTARVQQSWALGELLVSPWPAWPVVPVVSLGAGVTNLAVEGGATYPYRGVTSSGWFFGADAGAGVTFRLARRLDLGAEVHAMFAQPEPRLRFVGREVASLGEPALVGTLTVAGWL
jgi:hypothetical protein